MNLRDEIRGIVYETILRGGHVEYADEEYERDCDTAAHAVAVEMLRRLIWSMEDEEANNDGWTSGIWNTQDVQQWAKENGINLDVQGKQP